MMKRTEIVNAAYQGRQVIRDLVEHGDLVTEFDVNGATEWEVVEYMREIGFRWSTRYGYWSYLQRALPLPQDGERDD